MFSVPPPNDSEMTPSTRRYSPALIVTALIAAVALGLLVGVIMGRTLLAGPEPEVAAEAAPTEMIVEVAEQAVAEEGPSTAGTGTTGDSDPSVVQSDPTATASPEPTVTIEPEATGEPTDQPTDEPADEPTEEPAPPTPVPTATPIPVPSGVSPLEGEDLAILYDVWELIADQYDGAVPPSRDVIDAVISGSLETLGDEFTRYVPPDIAERIREDMQGAVEGIGAFVRENDEGQFEIVRPIDGQPADLAGLRPGDVIIAVDGESVEMVSFDEVILLVRGPQGTSVTLTVAREGEEEPLEFTIVRTRFEVPIIEAEILPGDITNGRTVAYLRLTEFNRNAEERLLEALETLLAEEPEGLILDLRDNPGGFLDQSVAVADAFLPDGVVLYERNIRGLDEIFTSDDGDIAETIPLVVLVNAGSASASEIVAGALQDRGRAVLVGETTFGKGSVQQIYTLSDGSELRVTIARWYTPNNNTIDGAGVTPDLEVPSPEDLGGENDQQLLRAIEQLLNGE